MRKDGHEFKRLLKELDKLLANNRSIDSFPAVKHSDTAEGEAIRKIHGKNEDRIREIRYAIRGATE